MDLFKTELLTLLKHTTKSHSHKPHTVLLLTPTEKISLLQDQIRFLLEQLKSKDKIINSLTENLSRNDGVLFSKQAATPIASENQTNYKQVQNTKTIDSN